MRETRAESHAMILDQAVTSDLPPSESYCPNISILPYGLTMESVSEKIDQTNSFQSEDDKRASEDSNQ